MKDDKENFESPAKIQKKDNSDVKLRKLKKLANEFEDVVYGTVTNFVRHNVDKAADGGRRPPTSPTIYRPHSFFRILLLINHMYVCVCACARVCACVCVGQFVPVCVARAPLYLFNATFYPVNTLLPKACRKPSIRGR